MRTTTLTLNPNPNPNPIPNPNPNPNPKTLTPIPTPNQALDGCEAERRLARLGGLFWDWQVRGQG